MVIYFVLFDPKSYHCYIMRCHSQRINFSSSFGDSLHFWVSSFTAGGKNRSLLYLKRKKGEKNESVYHRNSRKKKHKFGRFLKVNN